MTRELTAGVDGAALHANLAVLAVASNANPVMNRVKGSDQSTGTDPRVANAPINKYYCNLMNALGVKAGRDGFPARFGSEEVTRFGRYDRTEDFVGGTVNPPYISDPGEFTALRANS